MTSMTRTNEQLLAENEELKCRLAEAEGTLNAIRSGAVDAIVVPGREGEQVYSVSSAEMPYRTFIEEMNEGAVTLSGEGLVIYCNQRFAELVNEPIERVIGSFFKRFIAPNDRSEFDELFARKAQNTNNVLIISLVNSLYLKLSFHLLPGYLQGDNWILITSDISEIKREEQKHLELLHLLNKKLNLIEQLRMQLIENKIDSEVEIKKMKSTNKKLVQEITRHKQIETDLRQQLKHKKGDI